MDFTLSNGFLSLAAADPSNAMANDRVSDYPVGHALGQLLKLGDRLHVHQNLCGQLTYALQRGEEIIIGQGCLEGGYGSLVSICWPVAGAFGGRSLAGSRSNPNSRQLVVIKLAGTEFELAREEELWEGPYYVRCLKFGDYLGIPGHNPEIALIKSEFPEVRQAMRSFLDFNEKLTSIYIDFHEKVFPTGPYADNADRIKLTSKEFLALRRRIFRMRDAMVGALYLDFGMIPPQCKTKKEF